MPDLPIVEAYLDWLRETIRVEEVGDYLQISTPFLDRHNDYVQIYALPNDGRIRLTDDGFTLADLESSGVELGRGKRQDLLDTTLRGFGVQRGPRDELFVIADRRDLGGKKHLLVQAILAVGDQRQLKAQFSGVRVVSTKFGLPGKIGRPPFAESPKVN